MSRGLGSLESFIVMELGLRGGGPLPVPDLTRAWAHLRRSLARPGRRYGEACDCPGACALVTVSLAESVRNAARRLEAKGIVAAQADWFGRKQLQLAEVPLRWRPGRDIAEGEPATCAVCGLRTGGQLIRRQRRRAALPRRDDPGAGDTAAATG